MLAVSVGAQPVTYTFSGLASGEYIAGDPQHGLVARVQFFKKPLTITLFGDIDTVLESQTGFLKITYTQPVLTGATISAPGIIPNVTEVLPGAETFTLVASDQGPLPGFPETPFFHELALTCHASPAQPVCAGDVLRWENFGPPFALGNVLVNDALVTDIYFLTPTNLFLFDTAHDVQAVLYMNMIEHATFATTTAVPEPSTVAMLLFGVLVIAPVARRRAIRAGAGAWAPRLPRP